MGGERLSFIRPILSLANSIQPIAKPQKKTRQRTRQPWSRGAGGSGAMIKMVNMVLGQGHGSEETISFRQCGVVDRPTNGPMGHDTESFKVT